MALVIIGAGGHAKSCLSCLAGTGFQILGLLDKELTIGERVAGFPIIGKDADIVTLSAAGHVFFIAVGQIESAAIRRRIYSLIGQAGGRLVVVQAPDSFVDASAQIGQGSIIMHRAIINVDVNIGVNCIINTGAIIEHDAIIGAHTHVSTGAIINGGCEIGQSCFIGSGAIIRNGLQLGNEVVIGAGAVVVKNAIDPGTYVGNPARRIK